MINCLLSLKTFFTRVILLLLFATVFLLFSGSLTSVSASTESVSESADSLDLPIEKGSKIEIISYEVVFSYYYENVLNRLNIGSEYFTLEQFQELYYKQSMSIKNFADNLTISSILNSDYDNITGIDLSNISALDMEITTMGSVIQIISPDADYVLGDTLNPDNSTPSSYFDRTPQYEAFDYSRLSVGDIIFESAAAGAKHAAFIYKTNQSSSYGNYVLTIESVGSGVQYGFLDDDRMVRYGVVIYRIYRATELGVVADACDFLEQQIGKDYNFFFTDTNTSINSSSWYCSELVYAAYAYGGMDVCSNYNFDFDPDTMPCLPVYLTQGLLSGAVNLDYTYLSISIVKFTSGLWNNAYWTIRVRNLGDESITFYYNTKMCNLSDAQNWTNLNDIRSKSLNSNAYVDVTINQNYFANSIAFSYMNGDARYISYGSNLSKVDYSMTVAYNKIVD